MRELTVLHCDNHLLVVSKPAGVPTVPDESGDASLFDAARDWVGVTFDKPGRVFLGVVHRLDRPVSGVVVFARTSKSAARLSEQFRDHRAEKIYWGIGRGEPLASEGEVVQWLTKDSERNRVVAFDREREDTKRAVTRYRVLARRAGQTLYEFTPLTGRAHQLRVCAAKLGTPLLGDLRYGATEPLPDRSVALHARRLAIEHPTLRERRVFECAAPETRVWALFAGDGSAEPV